jgi:uncharacterized protein YbjQ (UPF0145 family)
VRYEQEQAVRRREALSRMTEIAETIGGQSTKNATQVQTALDSLTALSLIGTAARRDLGLISLVFPYNEAV